MANDTATVTQTVNTVTVDPPSQSSLTVTSTSGGALTLSESTASLTAVTVSPLSASLTIESKFAPKESPNFTGIPTAPTASAGTNTTQIATTAFVNSAITLENTLAEMDDVTLTSLGDNEILQYDTSSSKWLNQTLTEAGIASTSSLSAHTSSTNNPHSVTSTQVGLGNVTNESKDTMFSSPTFTGTPLAPTASAATNSTQIATTAYVTTAVSNLIDSAPAALDTLNELAAALNDDASFSTTVTNSIATKLPLAGGTMTGNIVMAGSQTVDGRDLSVDGAKLDGIEASATADQTAAEIRTLVESASDSNVFTDADHSKLNAIEASATADQTASEIRTLVESASDSNVFTDADHSKLNAIEASATADQTASEILTLIKTVDGASSGLDADLLDGSHASTFAPLASPVLTGIPTAPTANAGTNTTQVATTAFVNAAVALENTLAEMDDVNLTSLADNEILQYDSSSSKWLNQTLTEAGILPLAGGTMTGALTVGVDDTGHDVKFFGATSGKYMLWDESDDILKFPDSTEINLGTGGDLRIYHDGTNNYIKSQNSADLYIHQGANDKDIIFECDDGSGGVETYFYLDGSASSGNPKTKFPDNSRLGFGADADLYLYHDGSHSYMINDVGHLYIRNQTDDNDIIFQCDDGSGGTETYFRLDGSFSGGDPYTVFPDNSNLVLGTGGDLHFNHDGTNSSIKNHTGDLVIEQNADDKDIIFKGDNGSGGTETYFRLDGSASSGNPITNFPDNSFLSFGSSHDFSIYHDSTNTYIANSTNDLYIQNNADNADIIFRSDDGSGGVATYFYLDGGSGYTKFSEDIKLLDSVNLRLGVGNDLYLYHDGSNSHIKSTTSDLYIQNDADDKDIIFQCDDGSGSMETYFYLDGSLNSGNYPITVFPDDSSLCFGDGRDLVIAHNGTDTNINNYVGHLNIINRADDKDIVFYSDDGSGGVAAYIEIDGAGSQTIFSKAARFNDGVYAYFGTGYDMQIWHDGTNSTIRNTTGDLNIQNLTDDGDIKFVSDDGSGSTTEYFYLDGGNTLTYFAKPTKHADSTLAGFGTDNDLRIFHNATNSLVENITGDLQFIQYADDKMIRFYNDNGSGGTIEYLRVDGSEERTVFSKDARLLDDVKLNFGASSDLKIYHDGSNSYIRDESGTGDLIISTNAFRLKSANNGETMMTAFEDGATNLYHNNVQKFETTSTGIAITGGLTTTGASTLSSTLTVGVDDTGHDVKFFGATSGTYFHWDESQDKLILNEASLQIIDATPNIQLYDSDTANQFNIDFDGADVTFKAATTDGDIIFQADNGSGGLDSYLRIDGGAHTLDVFKQTHFYDSVKATFGTGNDLEIYHDGSNSYIKDTGTGNLEIRSNLFKVKSPTAEDLIWATENAGVKLFYDNAQKFETTAAGATVTGNLTVSADLIINGTTTTVNSTTVTIDDPVFTLGGDSAPSSDDNKDRGIEFRYHNGSAAKIGFFGWDDSASVFTFIADASPLSEVYSGSAGNVAFGNIAGTLTTAAQGNITSLGTLTTLTVDDITINGSTISDAGDLTIDVGGDIILDADGGDVLIKDGGTQIGQISKDISSSNFVIKSSVSDADLEFKGVDGGANITALLIDMSAGGDIVAVDNKKFKGTTYSSSYIKFEDDTKVSANSDIIFDVNGSTELMRLEEGGKVGIGTTSPQEMLHVYTTGHSRVEAESTTGFAALKATNNQGSYGWYVHNTSDSFRLFDFGESTDRITVLGDGKVGIGTTSPARTLSVVSGSGIVSTFTSSASEAKIFYKASGTSGDYHVGTGASGDNLILLAGTSERMRVTSSGSVGIGTTSPASLLDVRGTVQVGVDDTGHDVKFFGATAGSYMLWDESQDALILGGVAPVLKFVETDATTTFNTTDFSLSGGALNINTRQSDGSFVSTDYQITKNASGASIHKFFIAGTEKAQINSTGVTLTGALTVGVDDTGHDVKFYGDTAGSFMLWDASQDRLELTDDSRIVFGDAADASIWHNGTDTYIENATGDLIIRNQDDDKDIIFQCDDGSGGLETYFYLDGSASGGNPVTVFPDSSFLSFGTGFDFSIYHDSSNTYLANSTNDLYIQNNANDRDVFFRCDDGSGGVTTYFHLDGGLGYSVASKQIRFNDNIPVYFGDGNDLVIFHSGSESLVTNYIGNLTFKQESADSDIIFQCDDGSGGTETYFYLDGSLSSGEPHTIFPDNSRLAIGSGADFQIKHNGTDTYLQNYTGHLFLINNSNDKDIYFQSDDGSGGVETYFYLDGSANSGNPITKFPDSSRLVFGDAGAGDMALYHDGTNNYINTYTGDLILRVNADDKDIHFQSDDGSGGTTDYLKISGANDDIRAYKNIKFADTIKAVFGDGSDLEIYHDGTNSRLNNETGDLIFTQNANDKDIKFNCDNGSGNVETYFYLDGSASSGNPITIFPDNSYLQFGTGMDLGIVHNGTNALISNTTGNIKFTNYADDADIKFECDDGSGGVTEYFRVDGGATNILFSKELRLLDGVQIQLGTSLDMLFMHNGANGAITNNTGNLIIKNNNDDGDIIFECDDGSGGIAEYFRLDGGLGYLFVSKTLNFADNVPATFGPAGDLNIRHDGTDSSITNNTGDLYVRNTADDKDIIFKADAGGTEAEIMRIDGSTGNVGIGTSTPNYLLDVEKSGAGMRVYNTDNNGQTDIHIRTAGTTGSSRIFFGDTDDSDVGSIIYRHNGDSLAFETGDSERMRLNSTGLGIGTTSPAEKFHVSNGASGFSGSYNARTTAIIESDNSAGTALSIMGKNTGNSAIFFGDQDGETVGQVFYNNPSNYLAFGASGATQAVVNGTGLGIGTTSPSEKLHVSGNARIGNNTTNGHLIGRKDYSVTQTFSTGLTVELGNHKACHVKVFISGDWSGHSSFAYVGEFFIQNGGDGYNEPGIILTEHDNLHSDGILSKIVDGTSDSFEIQFRANTSSATSVSGRLCYHVMGDATSVS